MVRRQSTLFSPVLSPSRLRSVYSESDDHAHSHHEILLTSFPLALEWMDFDPEQPDKKGQPYVIRLSSCSQFSTMAVIALSTCRVYCKVMIAAVEDCKLGLPCPIIVKIVCLLLSRQLPCCGHHVQH